MGVFNIVKSSFLRMRSDQVASATSAARAKEASQELRAENDVNSQNRLIAALLKVSQLSESRRDRVEEEASERDALGGMDPDIQRQLMAAERLQASAKEKAEAIRQAETNRERSLISATMEAGRYAKQRRQDAAKRDDPNNPEHRSEQAQRAEIARGMKSYRYEREAEADKIARQQKAAIIQRAMEARATPVCEARPISAPTCRSRGGRCRLSRSRIPPTQRPAYFGGRDWYPVRDSNP